MNKIAFHIEKLTSMILADQSCPKWLEIQITENLLYEDGVPVVKQDQLIPMHDYQERFAKLISDGYSWINLTTVGVQDRVLVVAVELPSSPVGCLQSSVNISGFTNSAKSNGYIVRLESG